MEPRPEPVSRISVSLPPPVLRDLDDLVRRRGFRNRSQGLSSLITEGLLTNRREAGEGLMAGTITFFYQQNRNGLLADLAALKRRHLNEIIGSLQVQLERDHILEVILVQGPASTLQNITDAIVTRKGVKSGKLTLTSTLIPPLHPLPHKPARKRPAPARP